MGGEDALGALAAAGVSSAGAAGGLRPVQLQQGISKAGEFLRSFVNWLAKLRTRIPPAVPLHLLSILEKPTARNAELQNAVGYLFRQGATDPVVKGGTAGAVLYTKVTGNLVRGSDHIIKAREAITYLERIIRQQALDAGDLALAHALIRDLQTALNYKP